MSFQTLYPIPHTVILKIRYFNIGGRTMEFKGKVAMVTGASVGIGRATALLLAQGGADLVLLDVNMEKLRSVQLEVEQFGGAVRIYECDVSDEAKVHETVADALAYFSKIDILVNNAALWRHMAKFTEVPTSEWERYWRINVMGVVHCTQAVLESMLKNQYGRIINVSSVAGVYGNANMVHYSATKGAVIAMTRALAKEVTHQGVLVNSVSPGSVSSSANEDIDSFTPSELSFMGRTGTDRENAELICFLASDRASYISGQNIQIDGCRKKQ